MATGIEVATSITKYEFRNTTSEQENHYAINV